METYGHTIQSYTPFGGYYDSIEDVIVGYGPFGIITNISGSWLKQECCYRDTCRQWCDGDNDDRSNYKWQFYWDQDKEFGWKFNIAKIPTSTQTPLQNSNNEYELSVKYKFDYHLKLWKAVSKM